MATILKQALTVGEAGRLLGVSKQAVRDWIKLGALTGYVTPGGHRRVSVASLRAFLTDHGQDAAIEALDAYLSPNQAKSDSPT